MRNNRIQDRQCTCNVTLRRVRVPVVAEEKQYYERVFVNVGVQHAMRMRLVIYGLLGFTLFFPRYFINGKIFLKKKNLLNIEYLF